MISIVIPAFNESKNIHATIESVVFRLKQLNLAYELIVIDDHSTDDTFDCILKLNDPAIQCYRLSKQGGSHIAIRAGLQKVNGDAVIVVSADGQDNPEAIINLIDQWQKGVQVVWALRKQRKEPFIIRWPAQLFYWVLFRLIRATNDIDLSRADFFLLDKKVVQVINTFQEKQTSVIGMLCDVGFVQGFIEYDRKKRRHGRSRWTFKSRFNLAKDWIVSFSGLPLRITSSLGVTVAVVGLIYAIFLIYNAFLGSPVPGWSSIIVVVLILGGCQMIMLGIIGEYLWQNLIETKNRPLFIFEKDTNST